MGCQHVLWRSVVRGGAVPCTVLTAEECRLHTVAEGTTQDAAAQNGKR